MSIYATMLFLKFPVRKGSGSPDPGGEEWVTVLAQGVPSHIDYECVYLPPPIPENEDGRLRAMVFVKDGSVKGTSRGGQEYAEPLLVLSGDEYAALPFPRLYQRLMDALAAAGPDVIAAQYTRMSIYATQWRVKFPLDGHDGLPGDSDEAWVTVLAQGVPSHIDDALDYLPPPVPSNEEGRLRAVVFVMEGAPRGTARSAQEYAEPLLVLSGDEYAAVPFEDLCYRLIDAIVATRPAILKEQITAEGRRHVLYEDGTEKLY